MTRPVAVLLLAVVALLPFAGAAAADPTTPGSVPLRRVHVLCVGGSNDPSAFEGVCVWVPLPV